MCGHDANARPWLPRRSGEESAMAKHVSRAEGGALPLGAYSHGWRAGDFIYVTGTGAINPEGKVVGHTIEEQTNFTIEKIEAAPPGEDALPPSVTKLNLHPNVPAPLS